MTIFLNVILALSEGIPELDGPVACARDDLPIVGAEADREDIGCVANESTGGEASVEVPKTKCVIPR